MDARSLDFARQCHRRPSRCSCRSQEQAGFQCKHCQAHVSTAVSLSAVQNRNHCPYCLWSRHLDWLEPGDRLSACKSPMRPIGLTVKATRNKYGPGGGELMLIHVCVECEKLSINRIAADDDPDKIYAVFETSLRFGALSKNRLEADGIKALEAGEEGLVRAQLFGREAVIRPALSILVD